METTALQQETRQVKAAMHDAQIALDRLQRIEMELDFDNQLVANAMGAVVKLRDSMKARLQDLQRNGG